jgi:hypothetical protein
MRAFVSPNWPTRRSSGIRACRWQIGRLSFGNTTTHGVAALGHDQAELAQLGTDRVGKLGELTDKDVPRPMAHQHRLPGLGLDRHKAHRRLQNGSADRFGICASVVPRLTKGLT